MVFIADNGWLTGIIALGVLIVAGVVAFLVTRRWGLKAWPLLLCSALLLPVLIYAIAIVALYHLDRTFGLAGGFVIHANWLLLIVLMPTIIGASIGSASHRRSA